MKVLYKNQPFKRFKQKYFTIPKTEPKNSTKNKLAEKSLAETSWIKKSLPAWIHFSIQHFQFTNFGKV